MLNQATYAVPMVRILEIVAEPEDNSAPLDTLNGLTVHELLVTYELISELLAMMDPDVLVEVARPAQIVICHRLRAARDYALSLAVSQSAPVDAEPF